MQTNKTYMPEDWSNFLQSEMAKPYFEDLKNVIIKERLAYTIYPKGKEVLNAFKQISLDEVRVVLIGQDPYHGPSQANGLAFSVSSEVTIPPSLQNIFKELCADISCQTPKNGDLTKWANQGVLLLNSILTVRHKSPASHKNLGWELFTDSVIQKLSEEKNHLVFILWGAFAQGKAAFIDETKHTIITSPHPSPFSAHKGFFGSKPFSKTNEALLANSQTPIDWSL